MLVKPREYQWERMAAVAALRGPTLSHKLVKLLDVPAEGAVRLF